MLNIMLSFQGKILVYFKKNIFDVVNQSQLLIEKLINTYVLAYIHSFSDYSKSWWYWKKSWLLLEVQTIVSSPQSPDCDPDPRAPDSWLWHCSESHYMITICNFPCQLPTSNGEASIEAAQIAQRNAVQQGRHWQNMRYYQ